MECFVLAIKIQECILTHVDKIDKSDFEFILEKSTNLLSLLFPMERCVCVDCASPPIEKRHCYSSTSTTTTTTTASALEYNDGTFPLPLENI